MYQATTSRKVEHETACAAHAAWSDFDSAKDEWLAGGTPGMSEEAAQAQKAMTDPDADAAEVEAAHAGYHAACLAQAHEIKRTRDAALSSIRQIMCTVRAETAEAEVVSQDRAEAVDTTTRTHAGVIHTSILSARTSEQRAGAG